MRSHFSYNAPGEKGDRFAFGGLGDRFIKKFWGNASQSPITSPQSLRRAIASLKSSGGNALTDRGDWARRITNSKKVNV